MEFLWWILVGFVAGVLAKLLVPGGDREPKGCIMTILLGIAGSLLVGFVMRAMGYSGQGGLIPTIVGATIGAVVLILLFRKLWSRPA